MQEGEHLEHIDRCADLADTRCRERGLEGVMRRGVRSNPREYPGDGEHQFLVQFALSVSQIYSLYRLIAYQPSGCFKYHYEILSIGVDGRILRGPGSPQLQLLFVDGLGAISASLPLS